jgi:hypothetical protein
MSQMMAPAGSVLQHVSIDNIGCAEMSWLCGDLGAPMEPIDVMFAWSNDQAGADDENPNDWRHVGCLIYPNGTMQHVFGRVAPPSRATSKARAKALDKDGVQ